MKLDLKWSFLAKNVSGGPVKRPGLGRCLCACNIGGFLKLNGPHLGDVCVHVILGASLNLNILGLISVSIRPWSNLSDIT